MLYNLSKITEAGNLDAAVQFLITEVRIPIAEFIVIATFAIAFGALKQWDSMKAFTASIFISFIAAAFMWGMHWMSVDWVNATAVLIGIALIAIFFWER